MTDIAEYISAQTLKQFESSLSSVFGVASIILNQFGMSQSGGTGFSEQLKERLNTDSGIVECMRCIIPTIARRSEPGYSSRGSCFDGLTVYYAPIKQGSQTVGYLAAGFTKIGEKTIPEENIISEETADKLSKAVYEIAINISANVAKSAEMKQMTNAALKIAEHRSDFLANISHEMRTPLNAVLGTAEIALRRDMSDEMREYLHQIKSSAHHLLMIINDILDFSKIETGEMSIVPVDYELLSLINDVAGIVNNQIGSKNIEFTIDVPPDLPLSLKGDNVRIMQVLINLLNNAVKFTKSGNVSLKISTRPISDENVMLIASVSDTGCGISQENIGRLFKMFRQIDSKRNRNVEGTGLGLAISKKLLGLMGGTISVESEPGKGSTFTFEVPQEITREERSVAQSAPAGTVVCLLLGNQYLRQSVETAVREIGAVTVSIDNPLLGDKAYIIADYELFDDAKELIARNPGLKCILIDRFDSTAYSDNDNITIIRKPVYSFSLSAAMGIGEKFMRSDDTESDVSFTAPEAYVLIVDDNDINRAVAKGVIEPLGMQVDLAASGAECIEKVRNFRYDIIFMDHMMPEMDGIEAAHIIKQRFPSYADVPIIALTANAAGDAREMFLREGMSDFIAKPISLRTIANKIRRWLPSEKIIPVSKSENKAQSQHILPDIPELDLRSAKELIGSEKLLLNVIEQYYRSIDKNIAKINASYENSNTELLTIEFHSLKSTSKQIGADKLSQMAKDLETAGKNNNNIYIRNNIEKFLDEYKTMKNVLSAYFGNKDNENAENQDIKPLLNELSDALSDMDALQIDDVLEKISQNTSDSDKTYFDGIKTAIDDCDFDKAESILSKWNSTLQG